MDEMKIALSTKFMKDLISKLIKKTAFSKLGCDIGIDINTIEIQNVNGRMLVHADVSADMSNDDLIKMLKTSGLI